MKGTTIAAMILAAAAASAATIVALKKAHDKKRIEAECEANFDCIPEEEAETYCTDAEASDDSDAESESECTTTTEAVDGSCCADGVCSFSPEEDAETDQPAQIHMTDSDEPDSV